MYGTVVVSLCSHNSIALYFQHNDGMAVIIHADNISYPYLGKICMLPGRQAAKGRIADGKGESRAPIAAAVNAALPSIIIIVGPAHPFWILGLHGNHVLVNLLLAQPGTAFAFHLDFAFVGLPILSVTGNGGCPSLFGRYFPIFIDCGN